MIGNFPLIIRPAFTLGGTGGGIAYNMEEFEEIVKSGLDASMTNQARLGHHQQQPDPLDLREQGGDTPHGPRPWLSHAAGNVCIAETSFAIRRPGSHWSPLHA